LLAILTHDRGRRLQPNADAATLVDIGALGGNSPDDTLGGQYRRHPVTTLRHVELVGDDLGDRDIAPN
jgi:hypothetical protein